MIVAVAFAYAASPAAPASSRPRRNLVLITLDTTRADHLGAWGYAQASTPTLDALARRGVRFSSCDTAAPVTLPSHATILSGLYPPRHTVRDNGTFRLPARIETVAESLAAGGWDTGAVVSAIVLARRHELDQGFRLYDDDLGSGYTAGTSVQERTGDKTTAAALAVAAKLTPPYFLWVHYYDPHEEYRPPTRFADRSKGPHRLYDGEISFMDSQVGELLAKLPQDVDVIVVGDHGEMLGEHGETNHGLLLNRAARRVPLLLAGPDFPAKTVRDCLVRTADVTPTLLALAGRPIPPGLDGVSLWPIGPDRCDRTSYSESFLPFFSYKWYPLRAISNDRFLYVQGPTASLYDLRSSAGESKDLAPSQTKAAKTWKDRLISELKRMGETLEGSFRPENQLSAEEEKKLASLGYVSGGTGGQVAANLPDPRQMTDVASFLHKTAEEVQQGRCQKALPDLEAVARRDPHNFPALTLTAHCFRETGKLDTALSVYRRAALENPLSAIPLSNIGGILLTQNKKAEAEREFRRALVLDPSLSEAASNLARLLRNRGERAAGLEILVKAHAEGAQSADLFLERGLNEAEGGDLASALKSFRESARRDPANAVPLDNAARAAFQLRRTQESAQLYEQLLRIAPSRLDVWKTLGAIYLYELGDKEAADRCFRRALTMEVDPAERQQLLEALAEAGG